MTIKKTLKSCQNCRSAKAKCIPAPDSITNSCQRCIKYNKECIYAESQPRTKRGKQAHTRVAEVEKKLEDLQTLLESKEHAGHDLQRSPVRETGILHPLSSTTLKVKILPEAPTSNGSVTSGMTGTRRSHEHRHRDRDAIDKEILSEKEASDLLLLYRAAKQDFPFIYVDPASSLDTLRYEKPFLLLAILTITSQRIRSLQILLEKELREVLASKVIIEGELSYDVLQGLMFYLNWYHYNFRPCRQQIYLLTQLCVSMAIDLGLHKPPDAKAGFLIHPSKTCMATKSNSATPPANRLESMRTYIGVYCLTTSLSIMLRKPNAMSWAPYLERCCNELAKESEAPMDAYLIYYVQLLHICEDISSIFGYCLPEQDIPTNHQRLQSTVRAFVNNIQDISKTFPLETHSIPSLMSLYHASQTLAYEVILHLDVQSMLPSADSTKTTINPTTNHWSTSSIRTSLLLSTLDTVRACLDWFASLSTAEFAQLNLLDISRISYHLLILGRLTISPISTHASEPPTSNNTPPSSFIPTTIPSSSLNLQETIATQTLQINAYFDAFIEKFQQLALLHAGGSGGPNDVDERKSVYWQFHRSFLASRDWFSSRIAEKVDGRGAPDVVGGSVPAGVDDHGHNHHGHHHGHDHAAAAVGQTLRSSDVEDSWEAAIAVLPIAGMEASLFL